MKSIELSHTAWKEIREQLKVKHRPSVILIRGRMKAKLGYVDRDFRGADPKTLRFKDCVYLDFYDESKYTLFLMQYGTYMDKKDGTDF